MAEGKGTLSTNAEAHKLITGDIVKAVLHNDFGERALLNDFKIKDFTSRGDNYSCFVTSVTVHYSLNGKNNDTSYVVKLNPCRTLPSLEHIIKRMFYKEGKFYIDLLPKLNSILEKKNNTQLRIPKCLYVGLEDKNEIIVLEDMRRKSFKMFDRQKGLDGLHTTLVLRELAKLHGSSILLANMEGVTNLEDKFDFLEELFTSNKAGDDTKTFYEIMTGYIAHGAKMANKLKGYENVGKHLQEMAPNVMDHFKEMIHSTHPYTVVCHGDCWNNNLLFRYDEAGKPLEVCLLDLQINRSSSLALDLNYLFFSSLTGDVRKQELMSFISSYHVALESILKSGKTEFCLSIDDIYTEYRKKNLFGLIMSLVVLPLVVMESTKVFEYKDITDSNLGERIAEHRARIIDMLDTSPSLRPRLLDMFDEMIEHGVIEV